LPQSIAGATAHAATVRNAESGSLVAAVSNAGGLGGLGSLGASQRPVEDLREQLARLRALTDRPFAVNHLVPNLNEEAFALTVEARPAVISLALGDPGDLVKRAQEAGIKVMHQVHTVHQAHEAGERGVDVIIAQGSEAGWHSSIHSQPLLTILWLKVTLGQPWPTMLRNSVFKRRRLDC
jgi:enoyl-[acyl-carrier protein] reductase II